MRVLGIVALCVAVVWCAAVAQTTPPPPHPNSIAAQLAGPWHHVPNSVSNDRYSRDWAKCRMIAGQTPEINDIKFSVVLMNCLRAEGYEPGVAPDGKRHSFASTRFDDYSCADVAKLTKKSTSADLLFFAWARGFISGWNAAPSDLTVTKVDPIAIDLNEQLVFLRAFCDANPSKLYMAAVFELLAKLKYETVRRTGKTDE